MDFSIPISFSFCVARVVAYHSCHYNTVDVDGPAAMEAAALHNHNNLDLERVVDVHGDIWVLTEILAVDVEEVVAWYKSHHRFLVVLVVVGGGVAVVVHMTPFR